MENIIESYDYKRRKFLLGYLISFSAFLLPWIARFILREMELLPDEWNRIFLFLLFASIPFQAYFAFSLNKLRSKIKKDPDLQEALFNELVRLHETRAWRYAFIAMAGCLAMVFIINLFFIPIRDLTAVIITAILAGSGGYHLSFYFMEGD
ncbi:MAG: hypothetical protein JXB23_12945 [Candidatus Aminicenantes bacterium]|nr:hypothetical protein [Candidatus Aminicenantes bacterium]